MTATVYIFLYAGLLIFLAGSAWRAYTYARLPIHLRWELYPVPHEEPERARHGGSYFEEQEWWRTPQRRHLLGEWLAMAEEILLLKSLRESNPRLWLPSFLFHFGIYLSAAAIALAAAGAWLPGLATASGAAALAGAAAIVVGALLLLMRRLFDPALRNSTKPGDLFNLLFFLAAFVLLAGGALLRAPGAASWDAVARGALHFDRNVRIGGVFAAGLVLASVLAAYIPFTHMAHFVAKYFTWHAVRWDDRRSERGGAIEAEVAGLLAAKPSWSAAHMGADGQRSWAEIATEDSAPEVRR